MKLDIQRFAVTYTGPEVVGNYSWAKIQGRVTCEETYVGTSAENKSTIKCTVEVRCTTGGTQAANWRMGVTCNGVEKTAKSTYNMKVDSAWKVINTVVFENVPHNEDGSKVVAISGYAQAPEYQTSLGNAKSSFSGNMTLTTIPRESSISVNKETATLNDTIRVTIDRKSSTFYEDLIITYVSGNDTNTETVRVTDTYYDLKLTGDKFKYITGSSGIIYITAITYDNSGNKVAQTNQEDVDITVPSTMVPTLTVGDLYENGSIVPSSWGVFVKGKSEIGVPVNASGINGSTIKSISMSNTADGRTSSINTSSGILSTGKVSSNGTLTITATDSRGKSASKTVGYEVVDYVNPVLSTYSAKKVNVNGTEDENGQYIMFSIAGAVSSCGGNNVKKLYVAVNNQTNWISVEDDTVDAILSDITIDPNAKNIVYFKIEDSLGGSELKSVSIDSVFKLMNFNKTLTAVGLGKKSSAADNEELLEVDMDMKFYKDIEVPNVVSKNLFNDKKIILTNASITYTDDSFTISSNSYWSYGEYFTTLPAGTYTLSGNVSGNVDFIELYINGNWVNGKQPFTLNLDAESEIRIVFYATTGEHSSGSTTFSKVQLEKGTTTTDFVPYLNLKETILKDTIARVSNVVSRNLFNAWNYNYENDARGCNHLINNTNKITFNVEADWARKKVIFKLNPNTTYTINANIINNNGIYCGFWDGTDNNTSFSNSTSFNSKITFTTDYNGEFGVWFYCNFNSNAVSGQVIFDNIQLEEGTTATDYVPHLNLEEAMPKLKVINVGKSNYVKQGYISAIRQGNLVIVEVSELFLTEDRNEWMTFIGWGLPKPYLPGGGWVKGVLADNRGICQLGNEGNLYISQRTNVQLANVEYNCQIVYITLD
jgi:hypothetical protein